MTICEKFSGAVEESSAAAAAGAEPAEDMIEERCARLRVVAFHASFST
jgi:hypothetical protein